MTLDELLAHHVIRGVATKGCVSGDRFEPHAVAHAHWRLERNRGWICVTAFKHLNRTTIIHELAHLILGSDAHGEAWKRMVRQLGGRVERRYQKKPLGGS